MNEQYSTPQSITINKTPITSQFITLDIKTNRQAMQSLSGCAYKIYIYLCENKNTYKFSPSKKTICTITGISPRSYTNAKNELLQKGYFIPTKDGNLLFNDQPAPQGGEQKLPTP